MITMTQSQFNERMNLVCEGVANDLRNEIVDKVPVDTGALKGSIKVKQKGNGFEISALNYITHLEYGTPPHIIRAKNKKALFWKGAEHPVKQVNHPGTRPQFIIRNIVNTKLKGIITENLKRQFR